MKTGAIAPLQPIGQGPSIGAKTRKLVADIPGRVHCFSMLTRRRPGWFGGGRDARRTSTSRRAAERPPFDPESYRLGCPELSPSGRALLFVGNNPAGAAEIRLSTTPDGRSAKTITSGSDPHVDGRDDDDFVYEVDSSHAAIFSLPTMSFSLLVRPEVRKGSRRRRQGGQPTEGTIALLFCVTTARITGSQSTRGRDVRAGKTVFVPAVHRIQFGWNDETVLVSYQLSGVVSTLGVLAWRERRSANPGPVSRVRHHSGSPLRSRRSTGRPSVGEARVERPLE